MRWWFCRYFCSIGGSKAGKQESKAVLFEKQYMLGGLGTSGIVTIVVDVDVNHGK